MFWIGRRRKARMALRNRSVDVFQRVDGSYLVQTYSDTKNGFTIMDGPPVPISAEASAEVLGAAVVEGLGRVRAGLPPYDTKKDEAITSFLAFVGAKSYAKFCKGVRDVSVQIDLDYTQVIVCPQESAGPRGGFSGLNEYRVHAPYTGPTALGQIVLDAFPHATTS